MRDFFAGFWEGFSEPFIWLFGPLYRRSKFFRIFWKIISFPFWLVLVLPVKSIIRFNKFLNTEPEERPLSEVFVDLIADEDTRQMMWDQVEVLRKHLLRAVIVLILAVCASFLFTQPVMEYLAAPIGGLDKLTSVDMTESIGTFMIVALFLGIAIAVPYIAFEMWLFAAPGLRAREKKIGLIAIPLTLVFFLSGVAFTYYGMLPTAIPFLVNFMGMRTDPRPQSYFSLITMLMFWIGVCFEFPLVIYVLTAMGFVKPKVLIEQWRLAIVIITIVAAVITPTVDIIDQLLAMAPMIVLYFISIIFSYVAYAGRTRSERQEQTEKAAT